MKYRHKTTGVIETEGQIRRANRKVSHPTPFFSENHDPVFNAPKPSPSIFQKVVSDEAELIDGNWTEKWVVVDKFQDIAKTDTSPAVTKEMQEAAQMDAVKTQLKVNIRMACKAHILSKFDAEKQRNAIMGLYPAETLVAAKNFIQAARTEKTRMYEVIDKATDKTITSIESPSWWPGT